jgi:hypothetical protein
MFIDRDSGTVTLPNGYSVGPSLSQEGFRAGEMFGRAKSRDCGTLPWIHYDFSGGNVEGKELLVSVCFYDQMLVSLDITADLYPPGAKDWSNYSLDVEATTKEFHDRLLEQALGKPTRTDRLSMSNLTPTQTMLARSLMWKFRWGSVVSEHDQRGSGTSIFVSYGNRHEEASKTYRLRGSS